MAGAEADHGGQGAPGERLHFRHATAFSNRRAEPKGCSFRGERRRRASCATRRQGLDSVCAGLSKRPSAGCNKGSRLEGCGTVPLDCAQTVGSATTVAYAPMSACRRPKSSRDQTIAHATADLPRPFEPARRLRFQLTRGELRSMLRPISGGTVRGLSQSERPGSPHSHVLPLGEGSRR